MTQSNDYPLLHPTRIDIPPDIRAHLSTLPHSNHLYVQAEREPARTLSCLQDISFLSWREAL